MSKTYKIIKDDKFSVGGNTPTFRATGGKVWVQENILRYHMNTLDFRSLDVYNDADVVIYENDSEVSRIPANDWLTSNAVVTEPKVVEDKVVEVKEEVVEDKPATKPKATPKKRVTKKAEPSKEDDPKE